MNIPFAWSNAELAFAAYATLQPGETRNQLGALINEGRGLSLTQAQEFARRYPEVIAQVNNSATGFSMTVFRDSSGGVALAMRGTDELFNDWLSTNGDIAFRGAGYLQIVSMYNTWQRLTHVQGEPITWYRLDAYHVGAGDPVAVLVAEQVINDLGSPNAPLIEPSQPVHVTGHSLGGHLAMAFAGLFPDNTIEVHAFNAPGFKDSTQNQTFFNALGGFLPIGEAPQGVPITNVIADAMPGPGNSTVLPAGLHSRPGVPVDIAIENQAPPTDEPAPALPGMNHSMQILTDSLAVSQLLARLAPSLSASSFAVLLDSAALGTAGGLEKIMDAAKQTVGMNLDPLSVGNTQREALYQAIYETQASATYQALEGGASLHVLAESDAATLSAKAKQDFGFFVALFHLLPFALEGAGSSLANAHGDLYARWSADRSKRIANAVDLEFSDAYMADRAAFLAVRSAANSADANSIFVDGQAENLRFTDVPQMYTVTSLGRTPSAPVQWKVFGGDLADLAAGGDQRDKAYGGRGPDLLHGGGGDDYLEGGVGLDVYAYGARQPLIGEASNDGSDDIFDTDGKGLIRYTFTQGGLPGDTVKSTVIGGAGIKVSDTEWRSPDGRFTYLRQFSGLRVVINGDAGGSLFIQGFDFDKAQAEGQLGIQLVEAASWPSLASLPLPQTQGQPILGDLEPLVQVGAVPALKISDNPPTWVPDLSGHPDWRLRSILDVASGSSGPISYTIEYYQADANGNLIRTTTPASGMNDVLFDSAGNDAINAGGGTNAIHATRGGSDWIFAGDGNDTVNDSGGDNRIELGNGANTVFTGIGNDHIVTGDGPDTIADAGGSNRIEAGGGVDVISTGAGDDWVVGAAGDDNITDEGGTNVLEGGSGRDVIMGGSGADAVEGGTDADLLWGRDGNDQVWADLGATVLGLGQAIALGETAGSIPGQGDLLSGDDGNDILVGSGRADYLAGGTGRDVIVGGGDDDTIYGDGTVLSAPYGWSVVRTVDDSGPIRSYVVSRSAGFVGAYEIGAADTIYGGSGADWIFAGDGDDYVEGGSDDDVVLGEAGTDILSGGDGDDMLDGDSLDANENGTYGDDFLDGGAGRDLLFGGRGDDVLFGAAGDDQLLGGEGDDLLYGGPGTDVLQGGYGKDTYVYYRADGVDVVLDPDISSESQYRSALVLGPEIKREQVKFRLGSLIVDLGEGDALHFQGFDPEDPYGTQVVGSIQFADGDFMTYDDILAQGFVLEGTSGDDYILGTSLKELIDAGAGNDVVEGRGGNDDLAGGAGDDELAGGSGDDKLDGGGGDDLLDGGAGNDVLAGGAGTDAYLVRGGMGADTITDGELGESNVLLVGAGVALQSLASQRVEDSLVLTLRGTSDSIAIADYFARPQTWTLRDMAGVETSLEAVVTQPDPYGGDFIAGLWGDLKSGSTAKLMARGYEAGWKALDQDTFEMFQDSAHLQYASQTTTETVTRAEAPFDVLSRLTTVDTHENVLNFGQRPGTTFHWALQSLESARLESDDAVIVGSLGPQSMVQAPGQAVLTLRREGPALGEQHTTWSNFGGVISFDNGTETVLANVRYDYELHSYRQVARVTDVSPGTGTWQLPPDTVAGNGVLVDMQRLEHRHVGLLELIGGDSDNVIYATGGQSQFDMTLLVDAGAGDDLVLGGALVFGNDGNDDLRGSPLLIGGDGDDRLEGSPNARFVYTSSEVGIDTIVASWTSAAEYIDWYYDSLGMTDWSERLYEGGSYAAFVLETAELPELRYFDSLEEAKAKGGTDIRYVEPLDIFAPVLRRDDAATIEAFAASGHLSRDVVQFGPGVALEDLELTVTVNGPASFAYPVQPWNAGGTLSVRWNSGLAGFDMEVPDVNYGFAGTSLVFDGWDNYRVGEGIEAFEFVDGGNHGLEDILARAAVALDFGYLFLRGSGSQVVESHWGGVDFAGDIGPAEISAYRDGGDLVLMLADGSAQAMIPGWYADPSAFADWFLHFADGTLLDAGAMGVLGVTRKGTNGADVLVGDAELPGFLYGYGGDDTLVGGAGDDYLDGGEGTDTYVFGAGSGADVIADPGPSILVFGEDVPSWSVNFGLGSLLLRYGEGESIRFTAFDAVVPQATPVFERLEFADGSTLTYEDFLQRGLDLSGSDEDDAITGTGIRDVIFGKGGNDTLHAGGGNDDLYGGDGDDTLYGGPGDFDALIGEEGADTYVYAAGDGWDEIAEWDETPGEVDRLQLQGIEVADVRVTRSAWNYYMVMGGADRLLLNSMAVEPAAVVERVEFADGTVWTPSDLEARVELLPGTQGEDILWGTAGADTVDGRGAYDEIYGNGGDDILTGGDGDDFYYFAAGDGHDTVDNHDTDGSYDSIYFANAASADAALLRAGRSLVISIGADSVTLADWYLGSDYGVDSIYFEGDGGSWDVAALQSLAPPNNTEPELAKPLADLLAFEDATFAFSFPADAFSDPDAGDELTYAATLEDGSALPAWLSYDAETRTFSGTPLQADVGTIDVTVTATDPGGLSAADTFALTIANVNDAPVVASPLPDVSFEAGASFSFDLPEGTFSDEDPNATLELSATRYDGSPLPSWLSFDPAAAAFSGTPALTDIGISHILVTAVDVAGESALTDFGLVVRVPAGMEATGTAGDDVIYGGTGDETLTAKGGSDYLYGDLGNDLLKGGGGNDVLQGGAGNDVLRGGKGQNVLDGGLGDDLIFGGAGSAFIVGGAGNDTLRVGSGNDVIAFNAGDGMDTVYGGRDGGNTLSFGGGIRYSDLALSKSGRDLVVSTGGGEGVTLKNWYAGNRSVLSLQVVLDATEDFDAASSDPLYNRSVQTFDFLGMVSAFDAARAATPGVTSWEITNALLAFHLSGADDMALGGDLAYWYGKNRTLAGISLQSAQQVIGAPSFGAEAQSLRPFSGLQEGFVKLA